MTRALLTRVSRLLAVFALVSASSAPILCAEPIHVTSGVFAIPFDDPTFFRFFGADGFVLMAGFVPVPASAQLACDFPLPGCAPGMVIHLGVVAGGPAPLFSLGNSLDSNVNGTPSSHSRRHKDTSLGLFASTRHRWCCPRCRQGRR